MEFNVVGIVGAGQMGRGITQVVSAAGPHVLLYDLDYKILEGAIDQITQKLNEAVKKGKLTEWVREKTLKNIRVTTRLEDCAHCDLIVEAAPEKEEIKMEIFEVLDEVCPKETLFATNTSSLSITRLASITGRSDRFIGLHFMNPVPAIKLVEIVRGWLTSDETFEQAKTFVEKLGKTVVVSKDFPGFIVNRLLMPMINEATFALMEGVGTVEAIDTAMTIGTLHPMGPLALADLIGLDTCLDIMEVLYTEFGDSKYRPSPLLRKYVEADLLGRKTGKGFYTYGSPS
ncbi:MAG TPA: 3-hydroxyacyl-CoA dehydrogenase NAD-binding domain-containing protein [Candidatus Manganitrophaceae bacterium]|nr:3-hydroxyacyl-CoA dehydrogenase NAD-binding domain-containing protein [Candidatus Manganitrophaceae bacterium]